MSKHPTPLTDKFIEDLKQALKDNKINDASFARDIGVRYQHLYLWFKHKSNPSSEYVFRIMEWIKRKFSK